MFFLSCYLGARSFGAFAKKYEFTENISVKYEKILPVNLTNELSIFY